MACIKFCSNLAENDDAYIDSVLLIISFIVDLPFKSTRKSKRNQFKEQLELQRFLEKGVFDYLSKMVSLLKPFLPFV